MSEQKRGRRTLSAAGGARAAAAERSAGAATKEELRPPPPLSAAAGKRCHPVPSGGAKVTSPNSTCMQPPQPFPESPNHGSAPLQVGISVQAALNAAS